MDVETLYNMAKAAVRGAARALEIPSYHFHNLLVFNIIPYSIRT